jgi:hypothetical protein
MYYLCIFVGEGITIPTSREIDGTYLDSNKEEIKKHFQKSKDDWPTHGITLMCDTWMGPMGIVGAHKTSISCANISSKCMK